MVGGGGAQTVGGGGAGRGEIKMIESWVGGVREKIDDIIRGMGEVNV